MRLILQLQTSLPSATAVNAVIALYAEPTLAINTPTSGSPVAFCGIQMTWRTSTILTEIHFKNWKHRNDLKYSRNYLTLNLCTKKECRILNYSIRTTILSPRAAWSTNRKLLPARCNCMCVVCLQYQPTGKVKSICAIYNLNKHLHNIHEYLPPDTIQTRYIFCHLPTNCMKMALSVDPNSNRANRSRHRDVVSRSATGCTCIARRDVTPTKSWHCCR